MRYSKKYIFILLLMVFSRFILADSQSQPIYKIATSYDSQPFLYIGQDGKITGFEVDLMAQIAKLEHFKVSYVPAIFPNVFNELKSGKVDIIGNVFNSPERLRDYNMSNPHYIDKIKFITLDSKGITDPFNYGLTVATLAFSPVEEEFKQKISADHPSLKIQPEETTFLGFKDLFNKKADILLTMQSSINYLTRSYDRYQYRVFSLPAKYKQDVAISFLMRKGDKALMNQINAGLKILKQNGEYNKLKLKYHL